MIDDHALEERALDALLARAVESTGFRPEGVARDAVRRVLRRELAGGASLAEVMRRAANREPELVRVLRDAAGVRETYLFRNHEQFEAIAARAPELATGGVLRAWSAGCATGEETWSLAATLAASVGAVEPARQISVLGTDIYEPGLEIARAGIYRSSSIRPSGPLIFPLLEPTSDDRHKVIPSLRPLTSFRTHDLRDPEPGQFDVILCRNVLIYFARPTVTTILSRLISALAPGGLLVFGTIDIDVADLPVGMSYVGRPELMMFSNVRHIVRRRPTTRQLTPPRPRSPTVPPDALVLHRSALVWIERGSGAHAERVLVDLNERHPDYLPGILERALVHVRNGDHANATVWMEAVLRRAAALPPEQTVHGLQALPVAFFRDTARAYLERTERGRR